MSIAAGGVKLEVLCSRSSRKAIAGSKGLLICSECAEVGARILKEGSVEPTVACVRKVLVVLLRQVEQSARRESPPVQDQYQLKVLLGLLNGVAEFLPKDDLLKNRDQGSSDNR